ncbi:unnamed protein product [Rotaria magnacalcarata]|uniref:Major facilitator superfamily (MFS) profile domain-containing protein n=1 Tax=Rotaria magnacalcarata TaxID=392030 RepID=A0A819WQ63_9BILA|nr:unnamed protein product [Rotaria magnacalcarata]CAF2140505.1 unnamed protein product [Rotaria magnacalcarata]CAF3805930.1 unnamed protein product [Rotaria magnacalcarata]CAF4130173.1 unnamed protein product [Rotaria magnacalcarata]
MSKPKRDRARSLVELLQRMQYQQSTVVPPTSTIDQLLNDAGSFGLYQKIQFLLVGILAVLPAMTAFNYVFIAATPDHRCQLPLTNFTDTFQVQSSEHQNYINQYIPSSARLRKCYLNDINSQDKKIIPCSKWVFDSTFYNTTISTDWNLICDRLHLKGITQNAYIMGTSGSFLTGIMSDRLGRRTTMYLLILVLVLVLNTTQLMMHSNLSHDAKLVIFTISRFLTGFAQTTYSITLVLLLEMTSATKRVLASNILSYFYTLGELFIMLIYYVTRDWSLTMWILTVYVMPFLCYYWCVPESARWLVSTGRLLEARKVLHRIANVNRRTLENSEKHLYDDLQRDAHIRPKRYSYIHVLISVIKSPVMRQRCLIIFYIMMTNLMVYLGIGMGITSLTNEHPYEIFLFSIFAEFFGLCLCHFCATKFGRKIPLISFFTLCSLSILAIPITHKHYPLISLSSALCAKLFISASQALSWLYTTETYPTVIRSTGVGLSVSIARLGGVWAPQISLLAQSVWFPLPYIIFSICSFIAAVFSIFLPETRTKTALPETIKQAEKSDNDDPSNHDASHEVQEGFRVQIEKLPISYEDTGSYTGLDDVPSSERMKSEEESTLTDIEQHDKIECLENYE